ncbi:hypothetical protein C8F01DRAFT_1265031 [Mycena amicta]|nr:hypothetical protein C8F01DRAFT_1265031 [Mycena amicta]
MAPQAPGFTQAETLAMLAVMLENKDKDGTGNGWKPQIWPKVIAAVNAVPNTPVRTATQSQSHNTYIKGNFELYCFVAGYSGTGWDDEEKCCVADESFQDTFFTVHNKKYRKCFTLLYDGAWNKATGDNVVQTGKKKPKGKENTNNKAVKKAKTSQGPRERAEMEELGDDDKGDGMSKGDSTSGTEGEKDNGVGKVNEDLTLSSPLKTVSVNARNTKTPSSKQPKSKPNSGGAAKRNSEAAMRVADSLTSLGDALKAPITLKDNTSHIDAVIDILNADETLMPVDEDGSLYNTITSHFAKDPNAARVFVKTTNAIRRKGIITGILKAADTFY